MRRSHAPSPVHNQYSHDLRVLTCQQCGAPLEVAAAGGAVRCAYCNAVNHLARRDEQADRVAVARAQVAQLSESERINRLRGQDGKPRQVPASLKQYLLGSELAPELLKTGLNDFVATSQRVKRGGPFSESERLFHLALLLLPALDAKHRRAVLETAIETLADESQRHTLRCLLVKKAVLAGETRAAAEWLALCNPRPLDLQMDTTYRLAACYLALGSGSARQSHKVLSLLGNRPDDVPIFDAYDGEATLLRATAYEWLGNRSMATQQLVHYLRADPRRLPELDRLAAEVGRLRIAQSVYKQVSEQAWRHAEQSLRAKSRHGLGGALITGAIGWPLVLITAYIMLTNPWPLNCGTNQPGAIAANTGIWGFFLASASIGLLFLWRRGRRLANHGNLSHARVVSANRRVQQNKKSTTIYCDIEADVLFGDDWKRKKSSLERGTLVPLGFYPCLVYEEDESFNLKLS